MNLVSIIIPVYNITFFREAFNSAYNQSYSKKEIIIVYDNNKKEDFQKIYRTTYKKKNVKLINNKKNLGVGIARNIGIKYSKGAFLAFLDSDDRWTKDKLKIQIRFMKEHKLNFTHTTYNIILLKIIRSFNYLLYTIYIYIYIILLFTKK